MPARERTAEPVPEPNREFTPDEEAAALLIVGINPNDHNGGPVETIPTNIDDGSDRAPPMSPTTMTVMAAMTGMMGGMDVNTDHMEVEKS